ncbi:MAG TPA: hypothetical protein VK789_35215 [Bryobacteraceae bacterium]|jgi:hypothetical protein|nr:hypothetical protein [Bryobacteraceae bacterium]
MTRRAFVLSLAAGSLAAETSKDRGKRLIEKTVQALGGDAFRTMRTRSEVGRAYSFYHERLSGLSIARIHTKYLEPDGKTLLYQLEREVLGKKQEDSVLFTTNDAYELTYRGARPLTEQQVKQHLDTTLHDVFYILRERLMEPGIEFEGAGADVVENQPVEAIDIFDSADRNVRVWVNSDTFLPTKQRYYRWDPVINDRREEVTRYAKYRDVGQGIMWPFSIERERDTERIYQMFSDHVTVNDPLPDSMFELPNDIKMLKRM